MDILSYVKEGFVFFDGGMGTQLQARGMMAGDTKAILRQALTLPPPIHLEQIH